MEGFNTNHAKLIFKEKLENLQEYVCSSKIMDEQTYRKLYEHQKSSIGFVVHEPLGGGFSVYRTRISDSSIKDDDLNNPSTFSYIPKEKCTKTRPKLQRCNFSGQPIFYASMSIKTNFMEIDYNCREGQVVYLSKWSVDKKANANLFRVIPPEGVDMQNDYNGLLKINKDNNYPSELIDYLRKFGEIMMNTEGNDLEKYLPCALLSNFIYNFKYNGKPIFEGQDSAYHGLIYPSVKQKDRCFLNVALKPEFVDKYLTLRYVIKGTVKDDLSTVHMQEIGFCHENRITWYTPTIDKDSIKPTDYFYVDKDNNVYDITKGKLFDINHKEVKNYYSVFYCDLDCWMEKKTANFPDEFGDMSFIEDEQSMIKTIDGLIVGRDLEGWTFEYKNKTIDIVRVYYKYKYTSILVRN